MSLLFAFAAVTWSVRQLVTKRPPQPNELVTIGYYYYYELVAIVIEHLTEPAPVFNSNSSVYIRNYLKWQTRNSQNQNCLSSFFFILLACLAPWCDKCCVQNSLQYTGNSSFWAQLWLNCCHFCRQDCVQAVRCYSSVHMLETTNVWVVQCSDFYCEVTW